MARAWTSLGVGLAMLALAAAWQGSAGTAHALAPSSARVVHFQGDTVRVPAGWPVIRLAERPRTCVRLDRRAVYLGSPRPDQRCPASAMGRRRAILVDPAGAVRAGRAEARASRAPRARISAVSGFVGLGFDACAAPSRRSMRAWDSSPYRAVGVYIGGINRACSQPSLTSRWVAEQVAAGWSLIPTYVGLQAPTSSCTSCATLSPATAASQGTAAAIDAVEDAAAIGLGPGSPIYYDMEGYSRTSSATAATLAFLAAWTAKLHALGYVSGVYSSGASGIADLVDRLGTSYLQPDHIWIANWDGRKTADDPYVPDHAWSEGQRIRQYRGGHDETWGGVTINIDNNYVEGATAGSSVASSDDPKGRLEIAESPLPGQLRVSGWAFDPNAPGQPLTIRVYVGGKAGQRGALLHELGPVAAASRPDIALSHRASGGIGGFDTSFLTAKTGRERLCAYAVDVGPGSDKPLGCRTVGVPPPLSLIAARPRRGSVGVTVRCDWPAGTQCPAQILLRARVRVRVAGTRGGGRPRTKLVRAGVGRRPFRLSGGLSKTFFAPLSRRGRLLARGRDSLRTELVLAVPDGRIVRPLVLRPGSR